MFIYQLKYILRTLTVFKLSSLFNFTFLLMNIKHFRIYKNPFKVEYLRDLINYVSVLMVTFN